MNRLMLMFVFFANCAFGQIPYVIAKFSPNSNDGAEALAAAAAQIFGSLYSANHGGDGTFPKTYQDISNELNQIYGANPEIYKAKIDAYFAAKRAAVEKEDARSQSDTDRIVLEIKKSYAKQAVEILQNNVDSMSNSEPSDFKPIESSKTREAVKEYLAIQPLQSSESNMLGKKVRGAFAEFETLSERIAPRTVSSEDIDLALRDLSEADYAAATVRDQAKVRNYFAIRADRLFDRLQDLNTCLTNECPTDRYRNTLFHEGQALLKLNLKTLEGFEGIQLVDLVQEAALHPALLNDDYFHFHLASTIRQADALAQAGDRSGAIDMIDRAWFIFDYAKGLAEGVGDFLYDTASGFIELARHPLDSAEAIWDALRNYEDTFAQIKGSLVKVIDSYDQMSIEEQGRLHARIGSEVLSNFFSIGIVKNIGRAAKIGEGVTKLSSEMAPIVKIERIGKYVPSPSSLKAFPDAKIARPKTWVGSSKRKRWKDNKYIYEWDSQHGTVEKYNRHGGHLGEFDPETGLQTKKADPTRRIEP